MVEISVTHPRHGVLADEEGHIVTLQFPQPTLGHGTAVDQSRRFVQMLVPDRLLAVAVHHQDVAESEFLEHAYRRVDLGGEQLLAVIVVSRRSHGVGLK